MKDLLVTLYSTSMQIGSNVVEQGQCLSDLDKTIIMDAVGALLSALGIAHFDGVYSLERLKSDIKEE